MNLLLVDDEAFALEALEHAINWKSLGIDQVFTCGNIKAARQICQESDIQIMICDIEMPNGTGLDLAKWLSENYPDLLILFLTCHSDFSFAKEAISCHAFAYLLKPFDIEEISQAVEEAVQQSRNRQKLNRSLFASQPPGTSARFGALLAAAGQRFLSEQRCRLYSLGCLQKQRLF